LANYSHCKKLDGGKLDGGKLDDGKLDGGKLDGGKFIVLPLFFNFFFTNVNYVNICSMLIFCNCS
jgi:hypothetical protein